MRYVTHDEFRIAADLLCRDTEDHYSYDENGRVVIDDAGSPLVDRLEAYYDKCLRVNAKFVVALYFEQIREMHILKPGSLP